MRVSVVTAVRNCATTLPDAIESVRMQTHSEIEYIVVDGLSDDGTHEVVESASDRVNQSIREADDGIYSALNKGLSHATGDIVGFLHADDCLDHPKAIANVAQAMSSREIDAVYGDLLYVDAGETQKVIRYWKSGSYGIGRFRRGWMPPHPTVYMRREVYDRYGGFREDFGSGADYECLLRMMVRHRIRVSYLPTVMVRMRLGGASNSSLRGRLAANRSDRRAWLENGLKPPVGLRLTKPLSKLPQYFRRPPATR
ncbi:MAG: glycosyltransferase family 2 protein [Planctomycetota bacterium]